jgi:hypothetical protein
LSLLLFVLALGLLVGRDFSLFQFEGDLDQHLVFFYLAVFADVAVDLLHFEPGELLQAAVALLTAADRRLDPSAETPITSIFL